MIRALTGLKEDTESGKMIAYDDLVDGDYIDIGTKRYVLR